MDFESIRIKDVRAVLHYRPNIRRWRAEGRREHIIGVQLSGSAIHDFGYKKFVLSGNCILFFNRRDDYDVEVLEAGDSFTVHFSTYEDVDTESFCIPLANVGDALSILGRIESAKNDGEGLSVLSLTYRLCAEFDRIRKKAYAPRDGRMLFAKTYMDAHFTEPDCLGAAVAQSGLSARRFGDLFRFAFDTTPNRYIVGRRVDRAKSLLEAGGLTVAEIAELCGFSDVYYFSKVFKRETGVTPGKWK
jgi:AraC-like DNA-binding protein